MSIRVDYQPGMYEQSDLAPRKRMKEEDVRRFIVYWLQGRTATWLGKTLLSERDAKMSPHMMRSHARRLQDQGFIPPPLGYMQPHWRTRAERSAGSDNVPVVNGGRNMPGGVRFGKAMPPPEVQLGGPGRPRRSIAVEIGDAPQQYPGLNWRQIRDRRLAQEKAEAEQAAEQLARRDKTP